jgi:D-arabinitol 2-dehydrogenase
MDINVSHAERFPVKAVKNRFKEVGIEVVTPYGIRVNSISPGYMKTEMTMAAMTHLFPTWESLTPIGRLGVPEELRGAVIFLASEASSYMIGHDLVVDGGYTIR